MPATTGIVVINDNKAIAWRASTGFAEAQRMVRWLKDHGINARAFDSLSAWQAWSGHQD